MTTREQRLKALSEKLVKLAHELDAELLDLVGFSITEQESVLSQAGLPSRFENYIMSALDAFECDNPVLVETLRAEKENSSNPHD